jgi:hypothetical protein
MKSFAWDIAQVEKDVWRRPEVRSGPVNRFLPSGEGGAFLFSQLCRGLDRQENVNEGDEGVSQVTPLEFGRSNNGLYLWLG